MTGVDGGREFGVFQQKRASTGGATPSRLAAAMEHGSVGQTFLSALVDVRRQECPRHIEAVPAKARQHRASRQSHAGVVGGMGRQQSAVPAGSAVPGSRMRTRTRTKIQPPTSYPVAFDKVWGQGVGAEHTL